MVWRNYKRSGSEESYKAYRTFSNQVSTVIKNAKIAYESRIANSKNTKRLFKHVRTKLSEPVATIQIRDNSGTLTHDSSEVANILADTFSIAFTRESLDAIPNVSGPPNLASLSEVDFSECAIYEKLKK